MEVELVDRWKQQTEPVLKIIMASLRNAIFIAGALLIQVEKGSIRQR